MFPVIFSNLFAVRLEFFVQLIEVSNLLFEDSSIRIGIRLDLQDVRSLPLTDPTEIKNDCKRNQWDKLTMATKQVLQYTWNLRPRPAPPLKNFDLEKHLKRKNWTFYK